jgi:hypothetical protein
VHQARKWPVNIREMLRHIPTALHKDSSAAYFDSIDSEISMYKKLKDATVLLELAI